MLRVTAVWSGFVGSPGYSNFYFGTGVDAIVHTQSEADSCANKVRTFFDAIKAQLHQTTTILVSPAIAEINPGTGVLINEFTASTAPLPVVGTGVGSFAAPAGACISWRTAGIVAGKKIRGRTFLVPLKSDAYESNGSLIGTAITQMQTAGAALAAGTFGIGEAQVVWHRPVNGAGGAAVRVTGCTIADKVAILRSRRD